MCTIMQPAHTHNTHEHTHAQNSLTYTVCGHGGSESCSSVVEFSLGITSVVVLSQRIQSRRMRIISLSLSLSLSRTHTHRMQARRIRIILSHSLSLPLSLLPYTGAEGANHTALECQSPRSTIVVDELRAAVLAKNCVGDGSLFAPCLGFRV